MRCDSTHRGLRCEKTTGHNGVHEACNVDNHSWAWWQDSPGHGGPGQTSEAKEGSATPTDVQETVEPWPVDGERSPARVTHVNDPEDELEAYLRRIDPALLVPCQRRYLGMPDVEVPPSTWIPPGASEPEPDEIGNMLREIGRRIDEKLVAEDPGHYERVRARLFGRDGGGL